MVSSYLKARIPAPTTETVQVEIGEWLPDLPESNNPGAIEALNVIPVEGCYGPFKSHAPTTGVATPVGRQAIGRSIGRGSRRLDRQFAWGQRRARRYGLQLRHEGPSMLPFGPMPISVLHE